MTIYIYNVPCAVLGIRETEVDKSLFVPMELISQCQRFIYPLFLLGENVLFLITPL